jgi:hypothetical protein
MQESRLRTCALALPAVTEKPMLDGLMFQVRGRTFATEGWPEAGWAVVKLAPADQQRLAAASIAITAEPGSRGPTGVTLVRLAGLDDELLSDVLAAAWQRAYVEVGGRASASRPEAPDVAVATDG